MDSRFSRVSRIPITSRIFRISKSPWPLEFPGTNRLSLILHPLPLRLHHLQQSLHLCVRLRVSVQVQSGRFHDSGSHLDSVSPQIVHQLPQTRQSLCSWYHSELHQLTDHHHTHHLHFHPNRVVLHLKEWAEALQKLRDDFSRHVGHHVLQSGDETGVERKHVYSGRWRLHHHFDKTFSVALKENKNF